MEDFHDLSSIPLISKYQVTMSHQSGISQALLFLVMWLFFLSVLGLSIPSFVRCTQYNILKDLIPYYIVCRLPWSKIKSIWFPRGSTMSIYSVHSFVLLDPQKLSLEAVPLLKWEVHLFLIFWPPFTLCVFRYENCCQMDFSWYMMLLEDILWIGHHYHINRKPAEFL